MLPRPSPLRLVRRVIDRHAGEVAQCLRPLDLVGQEARGPREDVARARRRRRASLLLDLEELAEEPAQPRRQVAGHVDVDAVRLRAIGRGRPSRRHPQQLGGVLHHGVPVVAVGRNVEALQDSQPLFGGDDSLHKPSRRRAAARARRVGAGRGPTVLLLDVSGGRAAVELPVDVPPWLPGEGRPRRRRSDLGLVLALLHGEADRDVHVRRDVPLCRVEEVLASVHRSRPRGTIPHLSADHDPVMHQYEVLPLVARALEEAG